MRAILIIAIQGAPGYSGIKGDAMKHFVAVSIALLVPIASFAQAISCRCQRSRVPEIGSLRLSGR